jgi:Na+-translocating ferredoxin:NAD+ oxidoreductase RnfG subunit
METPIVVAIISLVGGVIVALIQQSRKENKQDHNVVAELLHDVHRDVVKVENKLDHVEDKLDGHIKEHSLFKPKAPAKKK